MTDQQLSLICDTYDDAIRDTAVALGGFKRVGVMLWPTMPADEAGRRLANCLNPEKRDKFAPGDLAMLRREARKANVHTLAAFEMRDAGYAEPQPLEPEDERAALQREFIQANKQMQTLAAKMARAGLLAVA